jgi:prevent-host-death family protein
MKTLSSREFNQDVSQAKRAARVEPVFITDRGRPTHVLMSFETFRQLTGQVENVVDLLAMSDGVEVNANSRAGVSRKVQLE